MSKEEYKDWLLPEDSDNTKARCKLCSKTFSLSMMGEPSLKSHAQGNEASEYHTEKWEESLSDGFLEEGTSCRGFYC